MKNKEKYIDDIIEVMKDCSKECTFRAEKMLKSKDGICSKEIDYCDECDIRFYQWLEEEYEPPKVDAELIVRCEGCEYNKYHICTRNQCPVCGHPLYVKDMDFCSYGKPKGEMSKYATD